MVTKRVNRKNTFNNTAFLLSLSDSIRPLSDSKQVQMVASRLIAEYLNADRAYYAVADSSFEIVTVEQEYKRGDVPSIIGRHKFSDFASAFKAYKTAQPLIINDVENEISVPHSDIPAYLALGIRSVISIPLIKNSNTIASLNVLKAVPYEWQQWEIDVIKEVAERTWEAVERANAEQLLRNSEEKYRNLFDAMDEGYCIIEMIYAPSGNAIDFKYLQVNRAFELNNGLFNAEGKTIREMAPTIEQKWIDIYDNVAQTGEPIRFEEDSIALNRTFSLFAFRINDPSKRQVAVIFTDISMRKKKSEVALANREKELKEFNQILEAEVKERTAELNFSKELLEKAFNAATSALIILKSIRNEDGVIVDFYHEWLNETALKLIGRNMAGTYLLRKFPQLRKLGLFDELVQVVEQNKVLDIDYHYKEDYYRIWVHIKAVKIDDGAFVWMEDISSRKRTEFQLSEHKEELESKNKQLENTIKELESFNYIASHDMQEPLRKIQTLSQLIKLTEQNNFSEASIEYFTHMQNAAKQMQELINDLLAFSQTKSGSKKFKRSDLNILLHEVTSELQTLIESSGATINADSLPELNVIPFQIKQVFSNLISNSIKFAKRDKKPIINITYAQPSTANGEMHSISFIDNGIGFNPKFNEQIFGLFKRLYGKSEYPGTGIGLAIVKKIIENHSGTIKANGIENVGATFQIALPAK